MKDFADKCGLCRHFTETGNPDEDCRKISCDILLSTGCSIRVKKHTALEAGGEPGIGYAKTYGNSWCRGLCLRSTGSEAGTDAAG